MIMIPYRVQYGQPEKNYPLSGTPEPNSSTRPISLKNFAISGFLGTVSIPNLYFDYEPDGQRVHKRVVADAGTGAISEIWYIRDVQGNVMATYTYEVESIDTIQPAQEFYLYGSSRLGSHTRNVAVAALAAPADTSRYARILGFKQYELTNHLGNVLATITRGVGIPYYDEMSEND